ncbi:hypothetical protein DJ68_05120 [Halorubrum sp. C3]|nr:hypothetical protein DJ68_05120 [Halorubrum sp. C3]
MATEQLTRQDIHDRLDESIHDAFETEQPTLVEALPAMGKSYSVIKWANSTELPLTIFTSRHELFEQYQGWCEDRGLSHLQLPAFHRECDSMGEDYPIEGAIRETYQTGISAAELHRNSKRYFGQKLPCQQGGRCSYMEKRDLEPENFDVLVGHYLQAHNERYVKDRYVAFDEFPGEAYLFEPTHNEATRAITNYLQAEDDLPFSNWKELTRQRYKPEYEEAIKEWKEDFGYLSHIDTRRELQRSPDFHAHAPLLTYAGLEFELLDNQWEYADLNAGRIAVKSPEDEWSVLIPPSLYSAESVVALDGTPTISKWRVTLGGRWMEHDEVLDSDSEKREYLRDVLGLTIIQTDAGSKPYQSGKHVNIPQDGTLLEGINEREGSKPALISSKKAIEKYEEAGVDNLIEGALHFGALKGSNEFATTRLGAVIGSPHPPEDEGVERWGALAGEAVERQSDEGDQPSRGTDLDFGPFGNALFYDVVNKEVLQAVMRFGRQEQDDEKGATVYVHTSRLPYWVRPEQRVEVTPWSQGMKEVVSAIKSSDKWPEGEWTNSEIAKNVSVAHRQVGELMKELEDEGYVSHWRGGPGNAYHWSNENLEDFTAYGSLREIED